VFIALPTEQADEILDLVPRTPGFGSVRVVAQIGDSEWATSLFPSKPAATYLLPIKKAVRQAEQIDVGDSVWTTLALVLDA